MLIKGEPQNDTDSLFKRIREPKARDTILADFRPVKGSKLGELEARFDIILGFTVEELDDGTLGGIGKSERSSKPRGPAKGR